MPFTELIADVESRRKKLSVFTHRPEVDLGEHLGSRHVEVEFESLPGPEYGEFVVVSEDGEYVGSVDLAALDRLVDPEIHDPGSRELVEADFRYLLDILDDTVFSALDRRRLLAASREIEDRALRVGTGTLVAGFQRLSVFESQMEVYLNLASATDLDVHVFGDADWEPPELPGITVHASDDPDVTETWFVAFDGGGDPWYECALVAREVGDGRYEGFWTYDPSLVDRVFEEAGFTKATRGRSADSTPDDAHDC
ncbi:DICT sensory domain-containing protein [Halobium salinum]|uniref:DICT sensory domain-containing protein n=1 Tax=Halobium salinum TaxID=1364940 RepID=A0ABD5P7L0_9EURY|nr:DICT sensory domain-containing protein [Halobium salinum]